jgi:hypothetical protein
MRCAREALNKSLRCILKLMMRPIPTSPFGKAWAAYSQTLGPRGLIEMHEIYNKFYSDWLRKSAADRMLQAHAN